MRRVLLALLAWVALATGALAQPVTMPPTAVTIAPYVGPGDIVSGATGWWGLRGYNAAYTGNVAQVCDSATGLVCATITWNGHTLVFPTVGGALCNNSTNICVVATLYDQSGNGYNLTQATNSKRPVLFLSATGGQPAMIFVGASSQSVASGVISTGPLPVSQPYSLSAVANQTSGGASAITEFTGSLYITALGWVSTTSLTMYYGGPEIAGTAASAAFHAVQVVANGASPNSMMNVDGSTTTGSGGADPLAANAAPGISIGFSSIFAEYMTGYIAEVGAWPSAFSGGNQSSMNSNQHTYWGF